MADALDRWWKEGVLYQLYPRSFGDSDGDGVGDLRGIIDRLDHLAWLGIDGVWLNPITVSPNDDWGYDVADYCDVRPDARHPRRCRRARSRRAAERGIRVAPRPRARTTRAIEHPWFVDARVVT